MLSSKIFWTGQLLQIRASRWKARRVNLFREVLAGYHQ